MPVPESSIMEEPAASWADRMEDLDVVVISPDNLPEPVETVEGNRKTIVSYEVEDEVRIKKVTRVFKILRKRVPKAVAARKKWAKFGDAAQDKVGPDPTTTKMADEVFLVQTTTTTDLEPEDDPLKKLRDQQKGMVTCRLCKGDHWTSRCPYKDSLGASTITDLEDSVNKPDAGNGAAPTPAAAPAAAGPGIGSKYVPPNQRGGENCRGEMMAGGSRLNRDDDQCTVRVTNLSEETQEVDLKELFSHFGAIRRTFLAKDKVTQQSKGFAFVSFHERSDAAVAIKNLDGFGYDHLILKVEWAKPSKQP